MSAGFNRDYRFDVQLTEGLVAESWFYEMTCGGDRFEVKWDHLALRTKRVYVEYEDDPGRRGEWQPSGIQTSESDCYVFVFGEHAPVAFVGVATERLRALAAALYLSPGRQKQQPDGSCPTRAVVVRLSELLGLADDALLRRAA